MSAQTTNWRPIVTGCRAVRARSNSLSARIVARIEDEIRPYEQALISTTDHREAVRHHMDMMLAGLAEHRTPGEAELEFARELGRRRARQGLPLYALIQAYHVGYQELWEELFAEVQTQPGSETVAALPFAAGEAWAWVREISAAVAEAHEDATAGEHDADVKAQRRFVELLNQSGEPIEELFDAARALGFEPEADFQAMCTVADGLDQRRVERIQAALGVLGGGRCLVVEHGRLLILWQRAAVSEVRAVLERLAPDRAVGVGLARRGFAGARVTVGDAERALAVATRRGEDASFAQEWLASAMLQSEDRLIPILEPGLRVAEKHPGLLEVVVGFAEADFSIAAMARTHYLHPNTATYRLERWRELTGWNARSIDGLMKSLACALLLRRTARSTSDAGGS
ncbi:PucR family transcriptional regulator [Conexibacter woesei]|uniref:PucR family transcriptional regulator n=1 Tax=Conexibacter woesei TaxID=191495 RepID=UPI0011D1F713|nr:helix-turn-helix domain-containing protein [Conexibacter woesei]